MSADAGRCPPCFHIIINSARIHKYFKTGIYSLPAARCDSTANLLDPAQALPFLPAARRALKTRSLFLMPSFLQCGHIL